MPLIGGGHGQGVGDWPKVGETRYYLTDRGRARWVKPFYSEW